MCFGKSACAQNTQVLLPTLIASVPHSPWHLGPSMWAIAHDEGYDGAPDIPWLR